MDKETLETLYFGSEAVYYGIQTIFYLNTRKTLSRLTENEAGEKALDILKKNLILYLGSRLAAEPYIVKKYSKSK